MIFTPQGERTLVHIQKQNKSSSGLLMGDVPRGGPIEGTIINTNLDIEGTILFMDSPTNILVDENSAEKLFIIENKNIICTKRKTNEE